MISPRSSEFRDAISEKGMSSWSSSSATSSSSLVVGSSTCSIPSSSSSSSADESVSSMRAISSCEN